MAKRVAVLMKGCKQDGDLEYDLQEKKSQHLSIKEMVVISPTTWQDVIKMKWPHKCQYCMRQFPTQRSCKSHQGHCRWKQHPVTDDDGQKTDNEYEVERVIDAAGPPDWRFYQIKWKG